MRIAVTGPHGNVGKALIKRGAIPMFCDVTDIDSIRKEVNRVLPDIIINPASKSKPDWCEKDENYRQALKVNADGILNLRVASENIPIVALSTDHVFSGKLAYLRGVGWVKPGPYVEKDNPWPINAYGLTKLGMEYISETLSNVKVVRTSNCFWDKDHRAMWYINELYRSSHVYVPTFQTRSFMHMEHFCQAIEEYAERFHEMPDVLHISGSKTVDWYTFILAFAEAKGVSKPLMKKFRKRRQDDNRQAKRPKKAGLKVDLSARLRLPQFDYLDGMEVLREGIRNHSSV